MEKRKVISFEKPESDEFITIGDLKKHLEDFDDSVPVLRMHEGFGPIPIDGGNLIRYKNIEEDWEDYQDLESDNEILENPEYIDALLLY